MSLFYLCSITQQTLNSSWKPLGFEMGPRQALWCFWASEKSWSSTAKPCGYIEWVFMQESPSSLGFPSPANVHNLQTRIENHTPPSNFGLGQFDLAFTETNKDKRRRSRRLGHVLVISEWCKLSPEKSLLTEESSATAWDSNVPPLLILAAFRINVDSNWWRSMWLLFDVLHAFQEGGWGGRWFGSRVLGEGEPGQIQFSTEKSFLWSQLKEVF